MAWDPKAGLALKFAEVIFLLQTNQSIIKPLQYMRLLMTLPLELWKPISVLSLESYFCFRVPILKPNI